MGQTDRQTDRRIDSMRCFTLNQRYGRVQCNKPRRPKQIRLYASEHFDVIYTSRADAIRCQCPSVCPSVCDGSALAHYS